MQKSKLYKLALFSLSAFLVFGCEAKDNDHKEVTKETIEYYKKLTPNERTQFDQMTKEEKAAALKSYQEKKTNDTNLKIEKTAAQKKGATKLERAEPSGDGPVPVQVDPPTKPNPNPPPEPK